MLCWTCTLAQVEVEREAAAKVVAAEGMAAVVARGWEVEEMVAGRDMAAVERAMVEADMEVSVVEVARMEGLHSLESGEAG